MKRYYVAYLEFENSEIQTREITVEDSVCVNQVVIKEELEKLYTNIYSELGMSNVKQVISWSKIE